MKKRWILFFILIFLVAFLASTKSVSGVGEVFVCAEKTLKGAWCQNVPENQASRAINPATNRPYQVAPTNCESTSFCKVGTCVDPQKGQCRPNVPLIVCQVSKGTWIQGKPDSIQQCQVGCCVVGERTAFVTQTGCREIAADYGIDTEFRTDIKDFEQCLALSNPKEKGACVIENEVGVRDCKVLTKEECNKLQASAGENTVEFNSGLLCTAETLATRCAIPAADKVKTTCVEGKHGVYFMDTCGNIANIYDAQKVNDKEYWANIQEEAECGVGSGNANAGSKTCGDCDYSGGSVCKPVERGNPATPQPQYGDFVCADLSCKYKGETYLSGEQWCGDSPGIDETLPGSEYYTLKCYAGEVTVETCDAYRQSFCIEGRSNAGYRTAACAKNVWEECTPQKNKEDCENTEARDCKWVEGASLQDPDGNFLVVNDDGKLVPPNQTERRDQASCVPKYAPGFKFWATDEDAPGELESTSGTELCLAANANCVVRFEKSSTLDDWDCKENCHCLDDDWINKRMDMCFALGDCGVKTNYVDVIGDREKSDFVTVTGSGNPDTGLSNEELKDILLGFKK